jgi:hypothetical protein
MPALHREIKLNRCSKPRSALLGFDKIAAADFLLNRRPRDQPPSVERRLAKQWEGVLGGMQPNMPHITLWYDELMRSAEPFGEYAAVRTIVVERGKLARED